ncbi:TetR/AcrR family transcriptional regulator [Mycobacterium sp.]|uniref:TetR/AcrR family transcriptional regulator n=1 Tax=Mycobacterium sp. TaxID=1785 RepID=UPI0025F48482|nr:TetR/AcrR family transcriptional regulator [Mycobacterium sp.]
MARRPKHDPKESEREILSAADDLLREQPFRELTVDAVMTRTGLKRPAFYVHFRDRHDLMLRIFERIADEVSAMMDRWLQGDDFERDGRASILGMAEVYARHGHVLRALGDAAAGDKAVEAAYNKVVEQFIDATRKRILAEQASGLVRADLDAEETARALVSLDERYLLRSIVAQPSTDPQRVADVLVNIWSSTLYGRPVAGRHAPSQSDTR